MALCGSFMGWGEQECDIHRCVPGTQAGRELGGAPWVFVEQLGPEKLGLGLAIPTLSAKPLARVATASSAWRWPVRWEAPGRWCVATEGDCPPCIQPLLPLEGPRLWGPSAFHLCPQRYSVTGPVHLAEGPCGLLPGS